MMRHVLAVAWGLVVLAVPSAGTAGPAAPGFGTGQGSVLDSLTENGRRHVRNETAYARLGRAGNLSPAPAAPPDVAAQNACRGRYGYRQYFDIDPPVGTDGPPDIGELAGPVETDPTVRAAMRPYAGCMKSRYGFTVDERTDFLYAGWIDRADAPRDGKPPTPAWTSGLARLKAAFAADVDCRRPAYLAAMKLLAPRSGPWERRHRAEIDAVRHAWRHPRLQPLGQAAEVAGPPATAKAAATRARSAPAVRAR